MKIVGILGSPSAVSRSGSLLQLAQQQLDPVAAHMHTIVLRDLPADALLQAQADHPQVREAIDHVLHADVLLVATPIYKAAYSGLLKVFLDLLPQDGLRFKTVLPLATGGTVAHLLALDYALKPVLSVLGARDILDPVFAVDAQIAKHEVHGYVPADEVGERLARSLHVLLDRAQHVRVTAPRQAAQALATSN